MPKKKNFLGGMQNYNPNNGEYEPALKGPNGESPSGFKSFKKKEDKDESFDTINKKRMGKSAEEINKSNKETILKNLNKKGISVEEYKAKVNELADKQARTKYGSKEWNVATKELEDYKNQFLDEEESNVEFKLDEKKYPDAEKTPYGFIYNVGGKSITDLAGQKKKLGYSLSTEDSGFTVAVGGEEVFFKDFDSAYKYAKGEDKNNSFDQINAKRMGKELPRPEWAKKIDAEMKPEFEKARKEDAETESRLKKFAEKSGIDYNEIKNEYINRLDKAIKESGFGEKDANEVALDTLEDDIVMGWKPNKAKNQTTGRKYDNLFGYTQDEFKKFYEQGKTIIGSSNKFYEIQYSPAQQKFYAAELNYKNNGFARKGRHYILSPKDANNILGKKVFWED